MRKLILLTVLLVGCISDPIPRLLSKPYINDAFMSAVQIIRGRDSVGSGVVLDTGYILTAAHVVDRNKDGKISKSESIVHIGFQETNERAVGSVLMIGNEKYNQKPFNHEDIAVVKITSGYKPKSRIKLASFEEMNSMLFGEPLIVLGYPMGGPIHAAEGMLSSKWGPMSRCTTSVYFGYSGGGVFQKHTQRLVGLILRMRMDNKKVLTIDDMDVYANIAVPGHALFVDANTIRRILAREDFSRVVQKKSQD